MNINKDKLDKVGYSWIKLDTANTGKDRLDKVVKFDTAKTGWMILDTFRYRQIHAKTGWIKLDTFGCWIV